MTVQDSRSQSANRELARERLLAAIENARRRERQERVAAREKIRRQKSPRPRGLKRRILEAKRHRGAVKVQRRSPSTDSH